MIHSGFRQWESPEPTVHRASKKGSRFEVCNDFTAFTAAGLGSRYRFTFNKSFKKKKEERKEGDNHNQNDHRRKKKKGKEKA